ncbi:MAG: DUF3108 domain-containing protein [Thiohalomonadaceae bacterium]
MFRVMGFLLVSLIIGPALADQALSDYSARYVVQLNGLKVGELQRSLQRQDNGDWLMQTSARTTGMAAWFKPDTATELSTWRMVDAWPQPLAYSYQYSGRSKDILERLEFDWHNEVLRSLRDGEMSSLELEPRLLDKQVFEIAMQQAIAQGTEGDSFRIAHRGRIVDYDFSVIAREELYIRSLGQLDTLKVQRGNTVIWLAPAHDYLPVKIEQQDGHSTATSYLINLSR